MDVLRTDYSAVNGVEWYAKTLNDALQTQCAVLRIYPVCPDDGNRSREVKGGVICVRGKAKKLPALWLGVRTNTF
ncbi:hypothetical protein TNCV_1722891 [Trichonephila clavipes]|nr:hypothetical protein TNCV_1722891 [Trichonephila clavipes]